MLSIFSALSPRFFGLLIVMLGAAFGYNAFAGTVQINNGSSGSIQINFENSLEFYNMIARKQKGEYQELFWSEVSGYFQTLGATIDQQNSREIQIDDLVFQMEHEPEVKLMVRNHDLISSHYDLSDKLSINIIDAMLIRDGIEIIYDYYQALTDKEMRMSDLLTTMGVQNYPETKTARTMGQLVEVYNLRKNFLGNDFINQHKKAQEWIALLPEVTMTEALDLAFEDDYPAKSIHPLLGGDAVNVHIYFQSQFPMFRAIDKLLKDIDSVSTVVLNHRGNIKSGKAMALYVCHHNLKIDQDISKEFKYFCDYIFYKSFLENKVSDHPTRRPFNLLYSRHSLSL